MDSTLEAIVQMKNDGMSYNEIADILNTSYDSVRGRWRRWSERVKPEADVDVPYVDWKETLHAANEMKGVYDNAAYWNHGMVNVSVNPTMDFILVLTSDWHLGAQSCDMLALEHDVDSWLATPELGVCMLGDMGEYGLMTQGMQSSTESIVSPEMQLLTIRDIIKEIYYNNKLLALVSGNHEERTGNVLFEQFRFLGEGLQVPSIGNTAVLNLSVGNVSYEIFVSHKLAGRTSTNPFGSLLKVLKEVGVYDIVSTAHVHDWTYGKIVKQGKPVHMTINGAYVNEQYAIRNYTESLPERNHYFVLGRKQKSIHHFETLDEAIKFRS